MTSFQTENPVVYYILALKHISSNEQRSMERKLLWNKCNKTKVWKGKLSASYKLFHFHLLFPFFKCLKIYFPLSFNSTRQRKCFPNSFHRINYRLTKSSNLLNWESKSFFYNFFYRKRSDIENILYFMQEMYQIAKVFWSIVLSKVMSLREILQYLYTGRFARRTLQ